MTTSATRSCPELLAQLSASSVTKHFDAYADVSRERREIEGKHARSLEQLSASIAHEIRNPVTAARILVAQMGEDPSSPVNAGYARVAVEELDRVERAISHLLRYSRDEELVATEVRAADVVVSALSTLRERIAQPSVTVISELDDGGEIVAAPAKLRRVVVNLLHDAGDHDHRPRYGADRRRGDEGGRRGLRSQAVRQRRAAHRRREGARAQPAEARAPPAARPRLAGARLRRDRGLGAGDARAVRAYPEGRRDRSHGAGAGRERGGQGAGGAGARRAQRPGEAALCRGAARPAEEPRIGRRDGATGPPPVAGERARAAEPSRAGRRARERRDDRGARSTLAAGRGGADGRAIDERAAGDVCRGQAAG
jgi:hypothetical protein